jgi:hypothetical protein
MFPERRASRTSRRDIAVPRRSVAGNPAHRREGRGCGNHRRADPYSGKSSPLAPGRRRRFQKIRWLTRMRSSGCGDTWRPPVAISCEWSIRLVGPQPAYELAHTLTANLLPGHNSQTAPRQASALSLAIARAETHANATREFLMKKGPTGVGPFSRSGCRQLVIVRIFELRHCLELLLVAAHHGMIGSPVIRICTARTRGRGGRG